MREWISVNDRLPELDKKVAVLLNEAYPLIAYLNAFDRGWEVSVSSVEIDFYWRTDTVTHWMPLPEPTEEEK